MRPIVLQRSEEWTFASASGREFVVSLAFPQAAPPISGYPVLYMLDPHTAFATLVDTVRNHEPMFGPVVIAGVGYSSERERANRLLDLTPPTDLGTLPAFRAEGWGPVGGADSFFSVFESEVKSQIRTRVPIDGRRQALLGHSLGGLFVLYVLFSHPEAFDTYVAASPSIWWGGKVVLKGLERLPERLAAARVHRRLLITVGSLEASVNVEELRMPEARSMTLHEVRGHTNMIENAASLAAQLKSLSSCGLEAHFVTFADETHNSVIPAYLGRAARYVLSGWTDLNV